MKILEGKNPAERKKIIAAIVLGALAVLSLIYTFGGMFFGGKKTTVTVSASPTPTATATPSNNAPLTALQLPNRDEMNDRWTVEPVVYNPNSFYAPDAGRNIFAFYEPAKPTPYVPTPEVIKTPPPPTPIPTPEANVIISFITPQNVYAGAKAFRLEVNGDKFTPETFIYWNGSQLPTNFISPQKLTADVPANLISGEGSRQIEVRSADGKLFSYPITLNVQAPPKPQVKYVGMIARRSGNNDTAYFMEQGKQTPFGARLNDIVGGRFRVVSISAGEVVLEDNSLGFRYRIPLERPKPGEVSSSPEDRRRGNFPVGIQPDESFRQYNQPNPTVRQQNPPGIPSNIPQYVPPPQQQPMPQQPVPQQPIPPQTKRDIVENEDTDNRF